MAAKPLPKQIKDTVIAEWRTGQYTQRELADKHEVSVGAVAKLTKGVDKDTAPIVSAGIAYQQALQAQDEQSAHIITKIVDETTKRLEWLAKAALSNVKQAMAAECEGQQDYRLRGMTINTARETIVGKGVDTAVQINNVQTPPEIKVIGV